MRFLISFAFLLAFSSCSSLKTSNIELYTYIQERTEEFDKIDETRKEELLRISEYIHRNNKLGEKSYINFICTHNSRRSHMAQIMALSAAKYFNLNNINCYSGGTEATAFNPNAIEALQNIGIYVEKLDESENPKYYVQYDKKENSVLSYSKKYDVKVNPKEDFCAVMVCSEAEKSCPFIPGARIRVSVPIDDPKRFDGTKNEKEEYAKTLKTISREMVFVMANVK